MSVTDRYPYTMFLSYLHVSTYPFLYSFFCRFLYRKNVSYYPDDLEAGFLKSDLLVKAYKHVFTSPASARGSVLDAENDSDAGEVLAFYAEIDRIHLYTKVHFSLSSAASWAVEYEGFNYPAFYNFIVDYLENPSGLLAEVQVATLLAWWNRYFLTPLRSSPYELDVKISGDASCTEGAAP
ncbi:hypothetical protein BDQ17DRAFT_1539732 [Cyathus striatus]|nr:hypothetical protein BDQ17DRAFT_1539732 [Cyathus striatus]